MSFEHLIKPLAEPDDAAANQAFHVVIPSLPGLGFSDPFPNNTPVISTAAEMLNTLMARLSYPHYLVSNAGAATSSPAEVDWKLINHLAIQNPESCLGAHLISPPLVVPRIYQDPWEWTKWAVANFLRAGVLGYSDDDFTALYRHAGTPPTTTLPDKAKTKSPTPRQLGLNQLGLREPNTIAYALCDSPTGLLVFVMKGLRILGPLMNFTPEELITLTELAWLPGPENAIRLWAYCTTYDETAEVKKKVTAVKPKVAITVFLGGKGGGGVLGASATTDFPQVMLPTDVDESYVCPAWGNAKYNVLSVQRIPGQPGLVAWERPQAIANGVRGLAREVLKTDSRLRPATEPTTALLEQVVIPEASGPQPDPGKKPDQQPSQDRQEGGSSTRPAPDPLTKDAGPAESSKTQEPPEATSSEDPSPDTIVVTTSPLGSTP